MPSSKEKSVAISSYESFYQTLLFFYPDEFRTKYGEQMFYAFQDLYQEELEKYGKVRLRFGLSLFLDTMKSLITEHKAMITKKGVKKYFRITGYNILGGILLLPFFILFLMDFLARVAQGDLTHYNRAWYSVVSHSFFYETYYGQPVLLWLVLIIFPVIAVALNVIPILRSLGKKKHVSLLSLFLSNPLALVIVGVGLFFLLVVFGHDVVPCTVHGLLSHGIGQLGKIISVCRNA